METILITGGTGMIGSRLCKMLLSEGKKVTILSRNQNKSSADPNLIYSYWNPEQNEIDTKTVRSADHIIHLAGAGVMDKRWNTAYKQQILHSRVKSGALLTSILKQDKGNVKTFISSSAIGWYGADKTPVTPFQENAAAGSDFLSVTCVAWEDSVKTLEEAGIRLCYVRTGIVLSKSGGALQEFLKPMKLGVAGILGHGNQIISWIHENDLCRIFLFLIGHGQCHGVYNGVAPEPVSNATLVLTLARLKKSRCILTLHIPSVILRMMLGEGSIEILKSTTVSATKIIEAGFRFEYPEITSALESLVSNTKD